MPQISKIEIINFLFFQEKICYDIIDFIYKVDYKLKFILENF